MPAKTIPERRLSDILSSTMWAKHKNTGFTIVELLIVIVVIAILAAITIVAYNGIQSRSRDAKRAEDFSNIKKALLLYQAMNDGVKKTVGGSAYTLGVNYSGWDSSVSPNWLAFLRDTHGLMPVDPTNTITSSNNPPGGGNLNYFYYCYSAGSGPLPATDNVRIGYHRDDGTLVTSDFAVTACLN